MGENFIRAKGLGEESKRRKIHAIIVTVDLLLFLGLLLSWGQAKTTSGDTGIAFGLVFMVGFLFVSMPLVVAFIASSVLRIGEHGFKEGKWLVMYLVLRIVGQLILADATGFLEAWF